MVFLAGVEVAKSQMVCGSIIFEFLFSFTYCTEPFSGSHRGWANGLHTKLMGNPPPFLGEYTHLALGMRMFTSGSPKINSSLFPVSLSGQRAAEMMPRL